MGFNYYQRHHLSENVYSKDHIDQELNKKPDHSDVDLKISTSKTQITSSMTSLINAKKSHLLLWAEQNGTVTNGTLDYSFGNGTYGNINFGLCIPVNGQITRATLSSAAGSSPSAEMKVNIVIDGTEITTHQIKKRTGNYSDVTIFNTPLAVSEGDRINFISLTSNSSITHAVVSILIEF